MIDEPQEEASAPKFEDEFVLELRVPIDLGGVTYSELKLSEPTVKQLREAAKLGGGIEWGAKLIQLNAAVPMAVVDRMTQRDFGRAADFFGHFDGSPK